MRFTKTIAGVAAVATAMGLGACSNMTEQQRNTAIGAGVGAVGGSAVTGGSTAGTLGGAAVGGYLGHEYSKDKKR